MSNIDMEAFNAALPVQQKNMLGAALFPKIYELEPELAREITGLLLEMDISDLLYLTIDDDELREKVNEARDNYNRWRYAMSFSR